MDTNNRLMQAYELFCGAEGSQHIASEYAIKKLQELILKFDVKDVLEVGLGIGSIAGSLLDVNNKLNYSGTENNNFCLKSLKVNLQENYQRLKLYHDLREIPHGKKYNLIIIDGKDANLGAVKSLLAEGGIIAVEGDRLSQQKTLQSFFPGSIFVHSISMEKNRSISPFSKESWRGGIKIIFVNPNLFQRYWWLHEKITTKLKYSYRKVYS